MRTKNVDNRFKLALEATGNLLLPELEAVLRGGWSAALAANSEIQIKPIRQRMGPFYRHLVELLKNLASLHASAYRRYFKLALAHPQQSGPDPHEWALHQLDAAVGVTLEWICSWYVLACDGPNQYNPVEIDSRESWRAPAWLFGVGPMAGIGPLKTKHVPATDSEEQLSAAHTRLLLKGARRVFLWKLGIEIDIVRNEEIAAAAATLAEPTIPANRQTRRYNKREGLEQKLKLYEAVHKILGDNPSFQGIKFCAELDRRHAPPLFDWTKTGEWRKGLTWKEAWGQESLKRKIRRVRQEAMKNR
jgi:hypothetical protein